MRELYKKAKSGESPESKVLNASVNIFHIHGNGKDWIIKLWGDVNHLDGTNFLEVAFGGDRTSG